jgi:TraL protein
MRLLCLTFAFLACLPAAEAASCRAGTAAQVGSQSGYNRAKEAADAWSQRQNNVSLSMGDCLGNISTTITAPTFPNLTDIMNQIGQKVCKAARDKISDYVPSTIDPWGDIPSTVNLSSYSTSLPVTASQTATSSPAATSTGSSSGSFISLN